MPEVTSKVFETSAAAGKAAEAHAREQTTASTLTFALALKLQAMALSELATAAMDLAKSLSAQGDGLLATVKPLPPVEETVQ